MSEQLSTVTSLVKSHDETVKTVAEKLEAIGPGANPGFFRERLGSKRRLVDTDDCSEVETDAEMAGAAAGDGASFLQQKSHPGRKARRRGNAAQRKAGEAAKVQVEATAKDPPIRKPRRTVVGAMASVDSTAAGLVGVPKVIHRDFKVCRLGPTTTVDQVRQYLTSKGVTVKLCEQLHSANAKGHTEFNNFRVKVLNNNSDIMWSPDTWPPDVLVQKYLYWSRVQVRSGS
jgi:hypothetical protein